MAISYPQSMPTLGFSNQEFEPQDVSYLSPETGGRMGGVSAGPQLWLGVWTLARAMSMAKSEAIRAFVAGCDGARQQFYGRDFARPYPLNYPTGFGGLTRFGGGAFNGTTTGWSVDSTRAVLTLGATNPLPAGFVINVGDYVGFTWTTSSLPRRALVRSLETVVANGSGVAVLTVRPAVPSVVPGGAVANMDNPTCLMRLIPSQTKLTAMDRRNVVGGVIAGAQDLLT